MNPKKSFLAGLRYARRADSGIERSRLLICLGWLELDRAMIDGNDPSREAHDYFQEAWKLARESHDSFFEVDAQLGCVWSALASRDLPAAVEVVSSIDHKFRGALPEYLELGLAAARGAVAIASGERALAAECFGRVVDHSSSSNSGMLWKSVALIGAGSLAWHSGRKQEAEDLWKKAHATGRAHSPLRERIVKTSISLCSASAKRAPQ